MVPGSDIGRYSGSRMIDGENSLRELYRVLINGWKASVCVF